MNIAVWIASGLLAAAYLFIGGTKLLKSKERLAENPSMTGGRGSPSGPAVAHTGVAPILAPAVRAPLSGTTPSPMAADPAASSVEFDGKKKLKSPRHCGRRIV